jgi:hypothetical protein
VWIGDQLRRWRLTADRDGSALMQKTAAVRTGLRQDVISQIELGWRRVDAVELCLFATVYGRSAADLARLFEPPSATAWAAILARRVPDRRFTAPPRRALPPFPSQKT